MGALRGVFGIRALCYWVLGLLCDYSVPVDYNESIGLLIFLSSSVETWV